jgi:hypothetical protein
MTNDDDRTNKKKPTPKVFTAGEYFKFTNALEKMAQTQMGALQEHYDGDELAQLFVPEVLRKTLTTVYDIEETSRARGEVWLNLINKGASLSALFDEPNAKVVWKRATMRVYFYRDTTPNGFITPTPLFGTRQAPIGELAGKPPEWLRQRFLENAELLLRVASQWTMVKWVVHHLQHSLRTPQQMRYVWPSTYTIAQSAGLDMDLSVPSSRAGFNAVPAQIVRPYLRETNDVVARSVLMGINEEYIARYNQKHLMITNVEMELPGQSESVLFAVDGV